jgi:hypothetical protein
MSVLDSSGIALIQACVSTRKRDNLQYVPVAGTYIKTLPPCSAYKNMASHLLNITVKQYESNL